MFIEILKLSAMDKFNHCEHDLILLGYIKSSNPLESDVAQKVRHGVPNQFRTNS